MNQQAWRQWAGLVGEFVHLGSGPEVVVFSCLVRRSSVECRLVQQVVSELCKCLKLLAIGFTMQCPGA